MNDDLLDSFLNFLKNKKRNHHAAMFGGRGRIDKELDERSAITEWQNSLKMAYGLQLAIIGRGDDPPDFECKFKGRPLSVEVTELVDPRALKAEQEGKTLSWDEIQWPENRALTELQNRLADKNSRYAKVGLSVDALVIYSDERWLDSTQVQQWAPNWNLEGFNQLRSAWLLLSYDPRFGFWPLIRLFGSLD